MKRYDVTNSNRKGPAIWLAVGLLLIGNVVFGQTGAGYDLHWGTIDAGGWTFSTGGTFRQAGATGQPDANSAGMTGEAYRLAGTTGQFDANGAGMTGGDYRVTGGFLVIPGPRLAAALSRKTHGSAGDFFDVDLLDPLADYGVAVEDRRSGPTQLVVTFDEAVQGIGGLDPSDVSLASTGPSAGAVSNLSINDVRLTINMHDTSDAARLRVAFPGIENIEGSDVTDILCLGVLQGDVTGDGAVNLFDLVAVRNDLNDKVDPTSFRSDVNVDGNINILDLVTIRNCMNKTCPQECP